MRRALLALGLLFVSSPSALAQRESGLVAHWRLSREHLVDGAFQALAGERPLTPSSAAAFVGEGEGESLTLAAGSGLLRAGEPLTAGELPGRRLSLEAWVVVDQPRAWGGFVCAIEDNGDYERGFLLGHKQNRFAFGVASEGAQKLTYLTAPDPFLPGRWYHVAGTYDGKTQRLFVDGEEVAQSSEQRGSLLYHDTHDLVVGAYKDENENYRLIGALHEVRIYDKALKKSDIGKHYRSAVGRLPDATEGSASGNALPQAPSLAELQPGINAAVDRGVAALLRQQHRDGSWHDHLEAYRNGQTSLATYALLKSGLPARHPAIVRALDFLRREPPRKTYSACCQLLALAATEDDAHAEWAQEIVDLVLSWESDQSPGGWAYPEGGIDLSNTQFVALGLWAGTKLGAEVPADVWRRMVLRACELHQGEPRKVPAPAGSRYDERTIAGFTYRQGGDTETGSMTTAGLCVIGLAQRVAGKQLGRKYHLIADKSVKLAMDWLEHHYTVRGNPGTSGNAKYYLYGLERVGALFELDEIGGHPWYREGAQVLIQSQEERGNWGGGPSTCFALLFLNKATHSHALSGPPNRAARSAETRDGEAWMRATGSETTTLWITGFRPALLERHGAQRDGKGGLFVVRVEYLVDREVAHVVEGDVTRSWTQDDRYPVQHTFESHGDHRVSARVHVVPWDVHPEVFQGTTMLRSGEIVVRSSPDAETWMRAHVDGASALYLGEVMATASSQHDDNHAPAKALDDLEATHWACASTDTAPWLRFELTDPLRARGVRLSPANSSIVQAGAYDAITRVRIVVNDGDAYELELPPDGMTWARLELPRAVRVRTVEVHVLDRRPGRYAGVAGFAEVALIE